MSKTRIRISQPTSKLCKLYSVDPEGSVWVKIRPPGMAEETERAAHTATRSRTIRDGNVVISTHINELELALVEVVLTFAESNLDIDIEDPDEPGEYVPVNLFGTRDGLGRAHVTREIGRLPTSIINEWHEYVLEVVPAWKDPFGWTGTQPLEPAIKE